MLRITADCDEDTLLIEVEQMGPACHTGNHSCFYNEGHVFDGANKTFDQCTATKAASMEAWERVSENLGEEEKGQDKGETALRSLYEVVLGRKETYSKDSYTCYLFEKGLDKILKKCGEECSEVIIAAKNLAFVTDPEGIAEAEWEIKNEICDLLYHLTVLMVNEEIALDDIYEILQERSRKIGNLKMFHKADHSS